MAPRWTRPECKTCPLAMFVFVSVPVSVCMSVRRIRPCVCLSVSVYLFIYPFVSLSVRLPAFLYNIILWSGIFDSRRHITVGNGKMDKLHAVTSWIFTQTRTPDYVYSDIYTFVSYAWSIAVICHSQSGIILCMRPANERRRAWKRPHRSFHGLDRSLYKMIDYKPSQPPISYRWFDPRLSCVGPHKMSRLPYIQTDLDLSWDLVTEIWNGICICRNEWKIWCV